MYGEPRVHHVVTESPTLLAHILVPQSVPLQTVHLATMLQYPFACLAPDTLIEPMPLAVRMSLLMALWPLLNKLHLLPTSQIRGHTDSVCGQVSFLNQCVVSRYVQLC